jgi:ParB family chromosome partitioning protein
MPSTQNAVNNHEYRSVPITALAESATNPRKRFDAKSLEELAASFKTPGILAPLLLRELDESKYEVVAGARRLSTLTKRAPVQLSDKWDLRGEGRRGSCG